MAVMRPREKDFERLKNSGRKAVMKLKRLPTNEELEKYDVRLVIL
jgi:hypothetical protein